MYVSIFKDTLKNIEKSIPIEIFILYCYSYHKICLIGNLSDHHIGMTNYFLRDFYQTIYYEEKKIFCE